MKNNSESTYGPEFTMNLDKFLLTIDKLEKLPTPRLLAYFKKYRGIRYSGICGCCGERYPDSEEGARYYEDCELWVQQIKDILNTREHVDN